jgi:S1-C subfamily serine protease
MIRNTIERTKNATFLVRVPSSIPEDKGFPLPTGTGFFISKNGYFVTANHVLKSVKIDKDLKLSQPELELNQKNPKPLEQIEIIQTWPQFDIALLKVNFENNRDNPLLVSKEPHSKLWGITGKGATPHRVTNGAAFIPPASWGVFSGDFYK